MKRIVVLHHWKSSSGYSSSECFDNIIVDKSYTAKDYCDDFDGDITSLIADGCDAVCVELMDEDFEIVSENWIYKED